MEIADTVDWRRVKNPQMLNTVSEIYENNGEFQKSRDILYMAFDRSPNSKKTVYRLGTLALKVNDTEEASDCYEEFVKLAPKDPNQYILKYKILKAQNAPVTERIAALQDFKKAEYIEKWAYELALLYHEAGMTAECLEECDDLILWFSEGKYVYQAMELKMKYKPLTPLQQEKYDNYKGIHRSASQAVSAPRQAAGEKAEAAADSVVEETLSRDTAVIGNVTEEVEIPETAASENIDTDATRRIPTGELNKVLSEMEAQSSADTEIPAEEISADDTVEEAVPEETAAAEEIPAKKSKITTVVQGATLEEALVNGVAMAAGINQEEQKRMAQREEEILISGQMKIDDILQEWEEKQKANAEAIEEQKSKDEERLQKEREELEARREAERLEAERREAEEVAARKAAEEEAARKAAEEEAARRAAAEEAAKKAAEEEAMRKAMAEEKAKKAIKKPAKAPILSDDIRQLLDELEGRVSEDEDEFDTEEELELSREEDEPEDDFEMEVDIMGDDEDEEEYDEDADEGEGDLLAASEYDEDDLEGEPEDDLFGEDEFEEDEFDDEDEFEEDGFGDEDEFEEDEFDDEDEFEEDEFDDEDEFEEDEFDDEDEFEEDEFDDEDEFEEDGFGDEDEFEEDEFDDEDEFEEDEFDDEDEFEEDEFDDEDEFEEDEFDDEDEFEEDEFDDEDEFEEDEFDGEDFFDDDELPEIAEPEEEAPLEIEEPSEEEIQKRIKKSKGSGVPFDTGFVVTGRYDLNATSEIGLKAGLTEEQKKLFSYFVPVRGMSEQIVEVLDNDRRARREGTSRTGNLLVVGRKGSGKTVLAVDIVKAIQKQRNLKLGKVAIVTGESLNKKELSNIIQKLRGGAIIIEKAGKLNSRTVKELSHLMEKKTGEMLFVLEDQRKPLERVLTAHPDFRKKFTSKLELPVFINDELVTFGQTYAKENGYKLDEMGILALYSRIDVMQREDHAVTVAEVKEIMDEAIEHSQKANVKHLARRVFGKGTDNSDRIILKEEDFKI